MKKLFTCLLICLSANAYALQITNSISIGPSDNVVNYIMSAADYNSWIANDGFQTSNQPSVITSELYQYFKDDFDVIMLITNESERPSTIPYYGINMAIANNVRGIGKPIYSNSSQYGSAGKLFSLMYLPYVDAIMYGPTLHEFCHCWANFAIPTAVSGHWGFCGGNTRGQLGGFKQSTLRANVDGIANKYTVETFGVNANGGNGVPYNEMELYLMGMLPIDSVQEFDAFPVVPPSSFMYYNDAKTLVTFTSDTRIHYTQATIIDSLGQRVPSYVNSQKKFKALFVVLSRQALTSAEWTKYENAIGWFCKAGKGGLNGIYNFWEATRGVGSIDHTRLSLSLKKNTSIDEAEANTVDIRTMPHTILCDETFRIYNLHGQDVTMLNGSLSAGIYFVRTTAGVQKVLVR